MRAGVVSVIVLAWLAAAAAVPAAPPEAGVLVPGVGLGGVRIGFTVERLERAWGADFGRCRDCSVETRYYNRIDFAPEGAGVELRGGRVTAVFTLWAPPRWHTDRNVYVGEPEDRVRRAHGPVRRHACAGYDGLVLRSAGTVRSVVYVVEGKVWGFGLLGRGAAVCR